MNNIIAFLLVWLYASIPFSLLIGFLYGKDIRKEGSGNIGGTNLGRTFGAKAFMFGFIADMSKGAFAVLIANQFEINPLILAMVAILSHSFSIFIKFKGGKGVATAFGFGLAYSFWGAMMAITVFLIVVLITRYVSLGSIVGIFFYLIYSFIFETTIYFILITMVWLFIVFAHRKNIVQIYNGTERKVKWVDKIIKRK